MKYALLPLFLLVYIITDAQVKISGKIVDNRNHPVRGISITLKNSYDGGTSDSLGQYSFTTAEQGPQILVATATGYRDAEINIILKTDPILINIQLKELVTELKAVVISAGAFEASEFREGTRGEPLPKAPWSGQT